MSRPLSLGICQVSGEPYAVEENRSRAEAAARDAFDRGADIAVLPEMVVQGYVADRDRLLPVSEPLDGPTVLAWTELAAEAGAMVAGGFSERDGKDLYNTAVLVGPDGVVLHYRKLHLFADEKHAFRPGDLGLPVADLPSGKVGICICYDLRFVETVRVLALRGAEVVLVPTAWIPGFDQLSWDEKGMAPQAHGAVLQANLNQVFISCASQAGRHGESSFLGSSIVADPRGSLLVGPMSGTEDGVEILEVDLDEVKRAQVRQPLIRPREDRRTDVYGLAVDGTVL